MRKVALTDVSVRAIKTPARGQFTVWDSHSPLGVRVSQGSSKTFIVMLGSGKRHVIGRFGIITLSEARTEARRILAEKTLGIRRVASTITFASALATFLEEHYRDKKPRTKHEAKRLLERHFLPTFRTIALADIGDLEICKCLDKIKGTPSEQLHAFRALRTMLRWSIRPPRRYIPHSPLEGYQAPSQDRKGTRILTDKELAAVWHAATGQFGDMVKLLILWGTRNGETGRLRRSWLEKSVLTIPGAYTKNKRDHAIPILPIARSILEEQPKVSDYFFPGKSPGTHFNDGSWGKFKQELDKSSGVNDWQLRDLRRTFRSNMPKIGVSREVSERLVNHVTGVKTELDEIYDRYEYCEEKRAALRKWETQLQHILQLHVPETAANISAVG